MRCHSRMTLPQLEKMILAPDSECDMGETNNAMSLATKKSKKVDLATHCLHYMYHGFTYRPDSFYASNPASTHQLYITLW